VSGRRSHRGGCHCGAIRVEFESAAPLAPRACQCSFCRRQDARSVSDPESLAVLTCKVDPQRYRFGAKAIDFLLCPRCGVYLGAMMEEGGACRITLNLNAFDDPRPDLEAVAVSYDGQSPEERAGRRRRLWTPLRIEGVLTASSR
jgi:hypothetical protein